MKKEVDIVNDGNEQLSLFRKFVANDVADSTNTIELWESIPKYFFTKELVKKIRRPDGGADPFKWKYTKDDNVYEIMIKPAILEEKDGSFTAEFPGLDEELVEEVLKKIFIDRPELGFHESTQMETWVRFNIYMIRMELKRNKKTRNATQIRRSIEIMSGTIITVHTNGRLLFQSSILSDLLDATKRRDTKANPLPSIIGEEKEKNTFWAARLPTLVSVAINKLEFRQSSYKVIMGGENQLTRWLYRKLVNNFLQASADNTYNFMYLKIKNESALLQASERNNRAKMLASLNELIDLGVIQEFDAEEKKQGVKIVDIKYTIVTTPQFIKDQKASNLRDKKHLKQTSENVIDHKPG